jgi:hypothetical protein
MESPDQLKNWVQNRRQAFDTLEPRPDLWTAIERQLDADEVIVAAVAPAIASAPPTLTATRGGQFAGRGWWQMAAAAVVVFALGYCLRMQTETTVPAVAINDVPAATVRAQPTAEEAPPEPSQRPMAVNGFRNEEPDPAVQATLLTSSEATDGEARAASTAADPDRELTQRLRRLEARYEALLAYHQPQAANRGRFTSSRPLADEWDHEMAALDSGYIALRLELTRNPNTDEVVEAMNRNLHMRLSLLNQQVRALDAMQQSRHRTPRAQPRRPPSVNPDVPTPIEDSPGGGWHSPSRAPSPAPMLDAATRPQSQLDASSRNAQVPSVVRTSRAALVAA